MTTDWVKIQIEYEKGATAQELADKYGIKKSAIYSRSHREQWKVKKTEAKQRLYDARKSFKMRIQRLVGKAFNVVEKTLDDPNAKTSDKLKAADMIFDLAQLKVQKTEVTTNQPTVSVQVKEADIQNVIEKINKLADE